MATGGAVAARLDRRCRYERTVFMLAHMRCGSTALSNVLCSHPEICGFGESRIVYRGPSDCGRLMTKCLVNGAWKGGFRFLYDKVLWNDMTEAAGPRFFEAKAIFSCRPPRATLASLLNLATVDRSAAQFNLSYSADYYEARLERLIALWDAFPPQNRLGVTHERLVADPEAVLARISAHLGLTEPLTNSYKAVVRWRPGVGDPVALKNHTSIVAKPSDGESFVAQVEALPASRLRSLDALHSELQARLCDSPRCPLSQQLSDRT